MPNTEIIRRGGLLRISVSTASTKGQPRKRKPGVQPEMRVQNPATEDALEVHSTEPAEASHFMGTFFPAYPQQTEASKYTGKKFPSADYSQGAGLSHFLSGRFPPSAHLQPVEMLCFPFVLPYTCTHSSLPPPVPVFAQTIAPVVSNTNTINFTAPQPCSIIISQFPATQPPKLPMPSPSTLCKISENISVCAGCRNRYPKQPSPPDDFCIRHQEWREYMSPNTSVPQSRFGNVYYHFIPRCVWFCIWDFVPSALYIPAEVVAQLTGVHKQHLQIFFQIHLS